MREYHHYQSDGNSSDDGDDDDNADGDGVCANVLEGRF